MTKEFVACHRHLIILDFVIFSVTCQSSISRFVMSSGVETSLKFKFVS
jgi:hypothetical protein